MSVDASAEQPAIFRGGAVESAELEAVRYESLAVPEAALHALRRALYHSTGPGYVVIPAFLPPAFVAHVRDLWTNLECHELHEPYRGKSDFFVGCPNYAIGDELGNRSFFNFFWAHPVDEVTHAVSLQVHWLRQRIMGRTPVDEMLPWAGRSTSYRVVLSRDGERFTVAHQDWTDEWYDREPARLQATLFLAEKGIDYSGTGFRFRTNQGVDVAFGSDVPVRAGDLVFWRYCNLHEVADVATDEAQIGFLRILYPPEEIHPGPPANRPPAAAARDPLLTRFKTAVAGTELGRRWIRPLYRRLRGRQ